MKRVWYRKTSEDQENVFSFHHIHISEELGKNRTSVVHTQKKTNKSGIIYGINKMKRCLYKKEIMTDNVL